MAVSSVFNLIFQATDRGSLGKMRNLIKGVGQESYKTFNAISRSMSNLDKATGRTLGKFTAFIGGAGFMAMGMKGLNYALIQSNSLIKTNTILLEEVIGNKGKAREMVSVIQEVAGTYGQDISELMQASRGVVQVMKQVDRGVNANQLERMLKMIMTVSSMDTENRGLAFTAFSFKEAFQGIGQQDWKSMMNRLEINIGRTYQEAITKAIKAGNLEEAISLLEKSLVNIGLDSNKIIGRLMAEGLIQNISRTASYINRFFQMLGEKGFNSLTKPFVKINAFLSKQFKIDSAGYRKMVAMSEEVDKAFITPFTDKLFEIGRAINTLGAGRVFGNFIKTIKGVFSIFSNLVSIPLKFVRGLFGIKDGFNSIFDSVINMNKGLDKFGNFALKVGDWLAQFKKPVQDFGLAINDLIVTLLKLSGVPFAIKKSSPIFSTMIKGGLKLGEISIKGLDKMLEVLGQERKTYQSDEGIIEKGGGIINKIAKGATLVALGLTVMKLFMGSASAVKAISSAAIAATTASRGTIIVAATTAATAAATAVMAGGAGLGAIAGAGAGVAGAGAAGVAGRAGLSWSSGISGAGAAGAGLGTAEVVGVGAGAGAAGAGAAGGIKGFFSKIGTFFKSGFGKIFGKIGLAFSAILAPKMLLFIAAMTLVIGSLKYLSDEAQNTADKAFDTETFEKQQTQIQRNLQAFYDREKINPVAFRNAYSIAEKLSSAKDKQGKPLVAGAEGILEQKNLEALAIVGLLRGDKGFANQLKNLVQAGGLPTLRKSGVGEEQLQRQYGAFYDMYRDTSFNKESGLGRIVNDINVNIANGKMTKKERDELIMQVLMTIHDKIKVVVDDPKSNANASMSKVVSDYLSGGGIGGL